MTALMHPTAAHRDTAAIACSPRCVHGRNRMEAIPATNPTNAIAAVATRRRLNCSGTTDLAPHGSAASATRSKAAEVRGRVMTVGRESEGTMRAPSRPGNPLPGGGTPCMRVMIIVGSVRPGRVGLPVAEWVRDTVAARGDWDVDFVDLAELALPFMDEPAHPRLQQYTKPHTIEWSRRVAAADAVLLVTPEYNYSYSPALKNALDFLNREWWMKPVGFVSYGGVSSGTRGVATLLPTIVGLGLVRVGANVEISFAGRQIEAGVYTPGEKEAAILDRELDELGRLAEALAPLRLRSAT